MTPQPPEINALLDAVLATGPSRPGPEWCTLQELVDGTAARGEKKSESSMRRLLAQWLKDKKAERREVTGRRGGTITYWRLTNGYPKGHDLPG